MKKLFCVGGSTEVFDSLGSGEGFETVRFASADDALEALGSDADGVVVEYDAVDDIGAFLEGAREAAPDASIVVLSEGMPEIGYRGPVVFDFVAVGGRSPDEVADTVRGTVAGGTQRAYPVPDDEAKRLEEVHGSLDESRSFTRLTKIARRCFGVDLAFVGVVGDGEERFLSCQGADMDEIPREKSVCTFQIVEDGVMVVEDLYDDARFEANEVVEELGMSFYAGAPIRTPSGANVGSFCVMDAEPRSLTEEERETLRLFAEESAEKLVSQTGEEVG